MALYSTTRCWCFACSRPSAWSRRRATPCSTASPRCQCPPSSSRSSSSFSWACGPTRATLAILTFTRTPSTSCRMAMPRHRPARAASGCGRASCLPSSRAAATCTCFSSSPTSSTTASCCCAAGACSPTTRGWPCSSLSARFLPTPMVSTAFATARLAALCSWPLPWRRVAPSPSAMPACCSRSWPLPFTAPQPCPLPRCGLRCSSSGTPSRPYTSG